MSWVEVSTSIVEAGLATVEASDNMPQSESMYDNFSVIKIKYPNLSKAQTLADLAGPTVETFLAGAAYFAYRGRDDYMRDVGAISLQMIGNETPYTKIPCIIITDDIVREAIHRGDQLNQLNQLNQLKNAYRTLGDNTDKPLVLNPPKDDCANKDQPCILFPSVFAARVLENPIDGLITIAGICSQLRDFANNRQEIDPENIISRTNATLAHFALTGVWQMDPVLDGNGSFDLGRNGFYFRLVRPYPKGIESLPAKMRYEDTFLSPPKRRSA